MRKLLLMVTVFALSLSFATAQKPFVRDQKMVGVLQKNPSAKKFGVKKIAKAPAKLQLAANQKLMGAYTSDDYAESDYGLGLPSYPGDREVLSMFETSYLKKYNGCKIVGMRFALANATPVSKVVICYGNEGELFDFQEYNVTTTAVEGWNEVYFDTPITFDVKDATYFFMGFAYTQSNANDGTSYDTECYPLSLVSSSYVAPTFALLDDGLYYDIGTDSYGTLSVQAIVESDNFPAKDIVLQEVAAEKKYYRGGDALQYAAALNNFGMETAGNVVLAAYLDGEETSSTMTANDVTDDVQAVYGTLALPSDIAIGKHELKVVVKTVDGDAPTGSLEDDEMTTNLSVYDKSFERQKNLVEQFTSQYCTNCPGGTTNLKNYVNTRDDIAWVSVHGDMSSGNDEFTTVYTDSIMGMEEAMYFPSASFNRSVVVDDEMSFVTNFTSGTTAQINNYFDQIMAYASMNPSLATVNISADYDQGTRKLDVKVNGEGTDVDKLLKEFGLTVYLTEDNIIARQGNSSLSWTYDYQHDHVLRTSLTKCLGSAINWNGDSYENSYSITIPKNWDAKNMNVVAFIAPIVDLKNYDYDNVEVNNAEILSLKDIVAAGIDNVSNSENAVEVARYNAAGQVVSAPQKGLNIIKMSNGEMRKVVVR